METVTTLEPITIIRIQINNTVERLQDNIKSIQSQIDDWSNRQYKNTKKTVKVGTYDEQGDTPWEPGIKRYSTKYINEKRRSNRIKFMKEQIHDDQLAINQLVDFQDSLSRVFSDSYQKAIRIHLIAIRAMVENSDMKPLEYHAMLRETMEEQAQIDDNKYKDFDPLKALLEQKPDDEFIKFLTI